MKKIFFLLCTTLIISCTNKTNENKETEAANKSEIKTSENFDWLLGNWKRLNDEAGNETFESWQKINETEYQGVGFTLKNGDTISQEKMQLVKQNNQWNVSVSIPSEPQATVFKVTQIDSHSFICENELNDFPKKIEYWFEGKNLKAKISNSDMEIAFDFEKIK